MPRVARGWCVRHYERWKTYGSPTGAYRRQGACDRCGAEFEARSPKKRFCSERCQRANRYAGLRAELPPRMTCTVADCLEYQLAKGLCRRHYQQMKRTGQVGVPDPLKSWRYVDNQSGYVFLALPEPGSSRRRKVAEHRHVMEKSLGRRLHAWENVHHINGVRDDNRLENLELWTKPQPNGQRPQDLAAWVVEQLHRSG